ncbi:MAG: ABC transporter permease [Opitutae bacterium]|nr:ABC transporter permease [Opitutae bacterium]
MNFFRRLRYLFRRHLTEAEMAEEMRYHLEQRAAELATDGLPADEARSAAQRKFGNLARIQEQAREARGWRWLENFAHDLRLGARSLLKSPGFSLLAIVTLGLGIGANTSMFSVLNGVMLKPLPYAHLPQLDRLYRATPQNAEGNISPADFREFQQAKDGYGDAAAYTPESVSLAERGHPAEMAASARATANLFSLLGVQPQLGRDFRPGEDTPGRDRVVLLSQRTWQKRFAGSPEVVGRSVRIDGEPHVVIGVLPLSFNDWRFLGGVDFFRPLALTPEQARDRTSPSIRLIARRAATVAPEDADRFVAAFGARLAKEFPAVHAETHWRRVTLQSMAAGPGAAMVLPLLIGLSGFVLLIACSNLANLLLARTMARAREFAVRAALGASRLQLLRPLIAESLLLALAGGVLALFVAYWFRDWAALRSTGDNGEHVDFVVDWAVMTWTFGASLATALAFGLAPALFALRLDLNATLKSGGRGTVGGRGHQRFRQFLIIGQFALAMVLLAGAGLFIRGLDDLNKRRSGWESRQLVTGTVALPAGTYGDAEKIAAFQRLALERLGALPGVASVCLSSFTPAFVWPEIRKFVVEGQDRPVAGREPAAVVNRVSPQYFASYDTRVFSGRAFTERDTAGSTRVFILNQAAARGLFGDQNPIGRRLAPADGDNLRWGEVVGVVTDAQPAVTDANPLVFQIYLPMAQEPQRQFQLTVRAANVAPAALVDGVRGAMAELDPDLPVSRLQPADATIHRASYQDRVLRDMLAAFGLLGLALASLGIYGVIARTMAQRTGEFAIRLALGASVRDIIRLVLGSGVRLALLGAGVGLLGAIGVTRLLVAAYPNLPTNSPLVLGATTLALVAVALLACWLPARRAGKIDAISALRAE